MYFQDVLKTLSDFWVSRGCLLWQPYHTEVGAGTSNPATFLRVLGPEPWWVGYVEPSIRPADGRYGENPNRLQHYHQYQVILKPSPPNVQELYLESLEALGLDLRKHDFRFVEDNWESPSLGAWGLGWEAWLDGMEVLQFTYFQECGGVKLDVRACELTYGVERIAMYLQGVENVYDLVWNASGITYGDIYHQNEVEFCHYNFEAADTAKLFQMYETWEQEGARMLERGLIMPAYDHCLKLSHLFNLLDARGALSVSERGRFLLRCRKIAEACAKAFVAQREEKGYPLKGLQFGTAPEAAGPAPAEPLPDTATLLLEIGVEELPHGDILAVLDQAPALAEKLLAGSGLSHGGVSIHVAPRRIALLVHDLPGKQADTVKEARGPKAAAARDNDGNWTVPARKFAEAQGATVDDIFIQTQGKDEYCFVRIEQKGRALPEILGDFVEKFMGGLRFRKSMGWEDTTVTFSRPVRWLVALHGGRLVPVSWRLRGEDDLGPARYLQAGRETWGHRRLEAGPITLTSADAYVDELRDRHVLVHRAERKEALRMRVEAIATDLGLTVEDDADLLDEVCDLVEWPDPILCEIPHDALTLPEPIIITPMKVHQKYFPLRNADGSLSRYFVAVANGVHDKEGEQTIKVGNEKVLNARLRDAKYFWDTDTRQPLEAFAEKLPNIVFHQKLGTLADKAARLESLFRALKDDLPDVDAARMAAVLRLMKADLATQMVFEFDSLEGVVGMLYAQKEGLDPEVAQAIHEHRLPRRPGDAMPEGHLGLVAGILDRLDTLAGYFGIGQRVKGTSDPFALRRNALALLTLIEHAELDADLEALARAAVANFGDIVTDVSATVADLLNFFADRLNAMARDDGYAYDIVAAALAAHGRRPLRFLACLDALSALPQRDLQDFAEQAKRMVRIAKEPADQVDPALLTDDEKPFFTLVTERGPVVAARAEQNDMHGAIAEAQAWLPVIATYFEKVLVNDPDEALRRNRHGLIAEASQCLAAVADFTLIEKRTDDIPVA